MKKIIFLVVFSLLPGALAAQSPALAQLGGLAAVKAAPVAPAAVPAAPEASKDRNTLMLLDPRTGKVQAVVPVGGGFIYASTGKFQPAVYNGSGYILSDGQYMPVVGGARKARSSGLSGKWLGQGEWTYQGSGAHCYMDMEFEDGPDYLFRKGGYFDCSVAGMNVEPARFVKKGTQLLDQDGLAAGSYENNVITLNEAYDANVDIKTTIKVSGLHFDYSEIWTEKNGRELYNIQGRLFTGGKTRGAGPAAQKMWEALNLMAKFEDLPLHVIDGNADTIAVRSLTCASEMYDACSFFVKVNGAEKLIVHTDAAGKIIDALYENGIYPSEDDPSLSQSAGNVSCTKTDGTYECAIGDKK